jgi:hypothetical protein
VQRARLFFATPADLRRGLEAVDKEMPLEYRLYSGPPPLERRTWPSLREVPHLGAAAAETVAADNRYIAAPRPRTASGRLVRGLWLGIPGAVPPASGFLVQLGGECRDGSLLAGSVIVPRYGTSACVRRTERFWSLLTGGYTQIRLYRVGPDAFARLQNGGRLVTTGVRSPRDHDLRL